MRRDLHYAVERAVTNIALRTVSTAFVIEEMYGGAPTIYVDYTGYDAIAHHCGPEAGGGDRRARGHRSGHRVATQAAQHTRRAYRLVVLSDHGQSLGATFSQRHGKPLEAVISALLPGDMSVAGTTDSVESAGIGRRIAAEFGRGRGMGSLLARNLPSALRPFGGGSERGPAAPPPDVVVASSGSLAHVYFHQPARPDEQRGESRRTTGRDRGAGESSGHRPSPGQVRGRPCAGTGAATVCLDLNADKPHGSDPLVAYGLRAAVQLAAPEMASPMVGDLILLAP